MKKNHCDRCGDEIDESDEMVRDFINSQYPGKDICGPCDLEITLAKSTTGNDIENNLPPGTTLKKMMDLYS